MDATSQFKILLPEPGQNPFRLLSKRGEMARFRMSEQSTSPDPAAKNSSISTPEQCDPVPSPDTHLSKSEPQPPKPPSSCGEAHHSPHPGNRLLIDFNSSRFRENGRIHTGIVLEELGLIQFPPSYFAEDSPEKEPDSASIILPSVRNRPLKRTIYNGHLNNLIFLGNLGQDS
ncbi:MAG: hypothetical protein P1U68_00005 [Verrucomicrobiales bacterium]|nr:hypothetical protein [Verrucomicrobiales bacterium]